ncbi:MAG: zinc-binding dehydrogenase [Spirochaeta sp.]|nr:zinc-binding dehydrogenase [Spirochaeta sp.]
MKTKAVRIYGKNDLRLEEFDLPPAGDDEILAEVISDSICMSSHKAASLGADHKRIPADISKNPTIIGHEFSGRLLQVGTKWQSQFKKGDKFSIQPALNYQGSLDAPGYSYRFIGGDATRIIIPNEVMECGCLLPYTGAGYFSASLAEPMSCIVGAFKASYHTKPGSYNHNMGIKAGGNLAMLAAAGPMGLGAIDYALHTEHRPARLVVTDIDEHRLNRARSIFSQKEAADLGVELIFANTGGVEDPVSHLLNFTQGRGYDDVFVFAPVRGLVECGDLILGRDGCLNFFSGPTDNSFSAPLNLYNVHYNSTHLIGTSGGNNDDMKEALSLASRGSINPSVMVTHIGGLDAVVPATLNLPNIPGGKKLIYTQLKLALTAISDFKERGKKEPLFRELAAKLEQHQGLWCLEAEKYLLSAGRKIQE